MEDNKTIDMEIQELRRQVESTKIEPVRRGKWLEGSRVARVYACSVCGWEMDYKPDYCPHCGANMYELEEL